MRAAKLDLRRRMLERRHALAPAEAEAASVRAGVALAAELRARGADQVVALYAGVPGEIGTGPLARALRAAGATLAYPVVVSDERALRFFHVADEAALRPGWRGIPEPPPERPIALAAITTFVVPGLAFDLDGRRLGWGRGHYDQTLAQAPTALRAGFAYAFQIVPAVPAEAHDEPVDLLGTEDGVRAARHERARARAEALGRDR